MWYVCCINHSLHLDNDINMYIWSRDIVLGDRGSSEVAVAVAMSKILS